MILILEKCSRLAIMMVTSVVLARLLGPEQVGLISYYVTIGLFLTTFVNFGLDSLITIDISKNVVRIWHYLLLRCMISIVLLFTLILFFDLKPFFSVLLILGFFLSFEHLFLVLRKEKLLLKASLPFFLTTNVLKIIMVLNEVSIFNLIGFIVLENSLFGVVLGILAYRKKILPKFRLASAATIKTLVKRGMPYFGGSIAAICYLRSDIIMLEYFADHYEVGIYSAANRFVSLFLALIPIIGATFLRDIMNEENNFEIYKKILKKWILASVILSIALFIASRTLILFLYGDQFIEATTPLKILVLCIPFIVLSNLSSSYLAILNMPSHALKRLTFGALVNIAMNYMLIPYFGAVGASVASLVAFVASTVVYFLIFSQTNILLGIKKNEA